MEHTAHGWHTSLLARASSKLSALSASFRVTSTASRNRSVSSCRLPVIKGSSNQGTGCREEVTVELTRAGDVGNGTYTLRSVGCKTHVGDHAAVLLSDRDWLSKLHIDGRPICTPPGSTITFRAGLAATGARRIRCRHHYPKSRQACTMVRRSHSSP